MQKAHPPLSRAHTDGIPQQRGRPAHAGLRGKHSKALHSYSSFRLNCYNRVGGEKLQWGAQVPLPRAVELTNEGALSGAEAPLGPRLIGTSCPVGCFHGNKVRLATTRPALKEPPAFGKAHTLPFPPNFSNLKYENKTDRAIGHRGV